MKMNFNSLLIFALLVLNLYTIHRVSLFERSNIQTVIQNRKLLHTHVLYADFEKLNNTVITLSNQLKHLWTNQIVLHDKVANISSQIQCKVSLSKKYTDNKMTNLRTEFNNELESLFQFINNYHRKINRLTGDLEKIMENREAEQKQVNEMVKSQLKGLTTAQNNIQNKRLKSMDQTILELKEGLKEGKSFMLNGLKQLKIETNETINHFVELTNQNYRVTMGKMDDTKYEMQLKLQELKVENNKTINHFVELSDKNYRVTKNKINDTKNEFKVILQEWSSNSDTTHELVELSPTSVSSQDYLYSQTMILLSNKLKEIIYSIQTHDYQTHSYSISSIMHYFASYGCGLYLHGGIVRDSFYQVLTNTQLQSNDIDFLYTCDVNLLIRLCNDHISQTIYGPGQFHCTQASDYNNLVRVFLNGMSHYYNIDFIPVYDYNLKNNNLSMLEMTDYTINSVVYSPSNNALYGIDKQTIEDLLSLSIRIPLKSLPKTIDEIMASEDALLWFKRPRKVSRYYKLLRQGYKTNGEIKLFITNVIKLILDEKLKELYPSAKSELIYGFYITSCNLIRGSIVYKYQRNYCIKGSISRDFGRIPFKHYKEIDEINTYFTLVENDIGTNLTQILSNVWFEVNN